MANDIRHINYKSDFSVVLEMPDGVPAWDWKLLFRGGVKAVLFEQTGGVLSQGVKKLDDTHVEVFFDRHGFGCGTLIVEFSEAVPDADYGDGYKNVHTPQVLPVVLWSRASDDTAPLGVTLQSSLDSAVANAVASMKKSLAEHTADTENPHKVTKEQLGLENVTNDAQVKREELGVTVATLDGGKIPAAQLPSYRANILDSYPYTPEFDNAILSLDLGDNTATPMPTAARALGQRKGWVIHIPEDADVMEHATKWTAFIAVPAEIVKTILTISLNDKKENHKLLITADETTKAYLSGNTLTFVNISKMQVFRVDCMAAMNVVSLDWHWLGEITS